ncbi:MAG: hypothetical protein F9K23_08475 [Bacteroidetes bacterium]|nr:MAG: hypothetical protein F9K23_08475 [Bacteroidota bacterium]
MEFRELLRKTVSRLFLVVWTPWGEEKEADIDISFGFVFNDEPSKLFVISVDKDELWLPHIFHQSLPENKYSWKDFYPKIKMWMNSEDDSCIIVNEYFDVTDCELFKEIVESEIIGIELIGIEGNDAPFGVKIHFKNDYIISTPISDGNTVETSQFNQNGNIEVFKKIGKVEYTAIG